MLLPELLHNPLLILGGTPAEVRAATRRVIAKLGPHGGLIVQDGNNIAPGSPLENINALHQAAVEFGPVEPRRRPSPSAGSQS